jgi:glycosyltransferase involved in cell wall biosynthesis
MRILLANYRYFVSGGPERYMFNVSEELEARGHEVIPFSIDYERNVSSSYARYFVDPLGARDEVYLKDQRSTPKTVLKTLSRVFYAPDVELAVQKLVRETQPDVAYVLHYLRKLSPSLLVGLKRAGLPIVVRLSDYMMLCPEAHFLRDSLPCQLCMGGNLLPSIRYRCVKGSLAVSVVNAGATWVHRMRGYFDLIDIFVVTNPFMMRMMLSSGYPENRLRLIPTFVNTDVFHPVPPEDKEDFVAFVGRLEFIKGVHVLIEAVALLQQTRPDVKWVFKLAGSGDDRYVESLKQRVETLGVDDVVQFVGRLDERALVDFIGRARLQVVPSLWYENLPNSLLESFACGTPVLASALGSLNDTVVDGMTGFHFMAGDSRDLAEKLAQIWDRSAELTIMSQHAREVAEVQYSSKVHLGALEKLLVELQGLTHLGQAEAGRT